MVLRCPARSPKKARKQQKLILQKQRPIPIPGHDEREFSEMKNEANSHFRTMSPSRALHHNREAALETPRPRS
jgi:hypothetical protein